MVALLDRRGVRTFAELIRKHLGEVDPQTFEQLRVSFNRSFCLRVSAAGDLVLVDEDYFVPWTKMMLQLIEKKVWELK